MNKPNIDSIVMELLQDYQRPESGQPDVVGTSTEDDANGIFEHVNNKGNENDSETEGSDSEGNGSTPDVPTEPTGNAEVDELASIVTSVTGAGSTDESDTQDDDYDTGDAVDTSEDTGGSESGSEDADGTSDTSGDDPAEYDPSDNDDTGIDDSGSEGGDDSSNEETQEDSSVQDGSEDPDSEGGERGTGGTGGADTGSEGTEGDTSGSDTDEAEGGGEESSQGDQSSEENDQETQEDSDGEESSQGIENQGGEEDFSELDTDDTETADADDMTGSKAEADEATQVSEVEAVDNAEDPGFKDEKFDEDGVLSKIDDHLKDSKDVSKHGDSVNQSAEIISEAREISDRLGDLAKAIEDRHPQDEAEEPAMESFRVYGRIAFETLEDHAQFLLGDSANIRGEDPEITASRRALETTNEKLNETLDYTTKSITELSEVIGILSPTLDSNTEPKELELNRDQINALSVDGVLQIEDMRTAQVYAAVTQDLLKWIGLALPQYFKQVAIDEQPELMPISTLTIQDESRGTKERIEADLGGRVLASSPVLAGNRAFVFHQQLKAERPYLRFVSVRPKQPNPEHLTLDMDVNVAGTVLTEIRQCVEQLNALTRMLRASAKNIVTLEDWLKDAAESEVRAMDLGFLLPYFTLPLIDLCSGINQYAWTLVSVLRDFNK